MFRGQSRRFKRAIMKPGSHFWHPFRLALYFCGRQDSAPFPGVEHAGCSGWKWQLPAPGEGLGQRDGGRAKGCQGFVCVCRRGCMRKCLCVSENQGSLQSTGFMLFPNMASLFISLRSPALTLRHFGAGRRRNMVLLASARGSDRCGNLAPPVGASLDLPKICSQDRTCLEWPDIAEAVEKIK